MSLSTLFSRRRTLVRYQPWEEFSAIRAAEEEGSSITQRQFDHELDASFDGSWHEPRRALAVVPAPSGDEPRACSSQPSCPLFQKLPYEVRRKIWSLVLGGQEIRVVRKVTKLAHKVTPRDDERVKQAARRRMVEGPVRHESRIGDDEHLAEHSLLPLLVACKRAYSDTLPVLYGDNRFKFYTLESFHRFLQRAPLTGLDAVRDVALVWHGFSLWRKFDQLGHEVVGHKKAWQDMCEVLIGMKSLKQLCLVVTHPYFAGTSSPTAIVHPQIALPLKRMEERVSFVLAAPRRNVMIPRGRTQPLHNVDALRFDEMYTVA